LQQPVIEMGTFSASFKAWIHHVMLHPFCFMLISSVITSTEICSDKEYTPDNHYWNFPLLSQEFFPYIKFCTVQLEMWCIDRLFGQVLLVFITSCLSI